MDERLARLAARRHGIFSRAEALREGATRGYIARRVAKSRWETMAPGVYRLNGAVPSWRQQLLVACLWAGELGVASHRAAAALWQLAGFRTEPIEISVPRGVRLRRTGIVAHEVVALPHVDVTVVDAIPVTTPTRTLVDLGAVVSKDVLEEALDDALRRSLTTISRLRWRLMELSRRGRPGIPALRALIDAREP
ncbi:MAG: type IV toxin-antitoxin system AbiEi family antitoxin domain-containing protein, partial [Actinomycetota bacterium]